MKFIKLITAIETYFKVCEADIISDMKKRIWFSTLPSEQINEITLSAAAEGRHNVIKYGSLACAKEMHHYYASASYKMIQVMQLLDSIRIAVSTKNYKAIIELSIRGFSDKSGWEEDFGGDAWLKIAQTLDNLIKLDEKLESVNKGTEEHIKVLKWIIVELNIFDGLSHNTASIMKNIVQQESNVLGTNWINEFDKIKRIMDIKELKNPLFVQRMVSLHGIGGSSMALTRDNPYRGKILSKEEEKEAETELKFIRARKVLDINFVLKKFESIFKELLELKNKDASIDNYILLKHITTKALTIVDNIIFNIKDNFHHIFKGDNYNEKEYFLNNEAKNCFGKITMVSQICGSILLHIYMKDEFYKEIFYKEIDKCYAALHKLYLLLTNF